MDFKKLKDLLAWPEFRMVWVLWVVLVVAFFLEFGYLSPNLLAIQAGLFFIIAILTFFTAYQAAKTSRGGKMQESELKSILYGLEDGLIVYDKNFNTLFANPAIEKILLINSELIAGHRFQPQDVDRPAWRLLAQVIFPSLAPVVVNRSESGVYPQVTDLSFVDPTLELRVVTSPIAGEDGKTFAFMKIIRNRTREISLIKSKNEFLTVASHQLRSPLTDINWALESLAGDQSLNETNKSLLAHALTASRELLKIVEDLLNVAKIEEGRFGYNFESQDILPFLNSLLAQVVPMAKRVGIKVYFDRPKEPLPQVLIDQQKLSLAVNNLLVNAVRYNIENGEVVVRVVKTPDKPFLEVSVKDTGIGISQEAIPKLFKKFFRSEAALKSDTEGSGLGLYIAKNIIQSHGGTVWVESEPGRGSTFYFTIPTDPNLVPKREAAVEE